MNKEELYELALSDVHKYNLLNEIFAIRDKRIERVKYTIGVDGYISLDVLNQYVNKIEENTNLKQALNEIRKYVKSTGLYETNINPDEPNIYNLELVRINDNILQIIDKVLGGSDEIYKQK